MRDIEKTKEQLIFELNKLRQEKNKVQTTLNRVTDAFYAMDNKWRYIYLNYEAERMFDGLKEEVSGIIGKCIWDLFPELIDSILYLKYQEAMKKQISVQFEFECIFTGRWFDMRAYPSNDGISVFITDITERKKMEEVFLTQREKLSVIFNASPSAMGLLTFPDYKYVDINESFENITEFNKDEVIGSTPGDRKIWLDTNQRDFIVNTLYENDTCNNLEIDIITKTKRVRTILASLRKISLGRKHYILLVFDDITEHKALEQELKTSNQLLRKAFDICPFPMSITSVDDGTVIEINESFLETFDCNREDVIGDTTLNLNFYSESELRNKLIRELLQNGYFKNVEGGIQTKSGVKRIALLSGGLIDYHGKLCMFAAVNDITEIKLFHAEMARLNVLNVVGQMASGIGHEVRNPMTSVKGFLQLLANKETDSKKKEYYDLMVEELDRANSIITEFLSLANDRMVELKPASLNTVINALYPLLRSDAMKQDKRIILNKGNIPNLPVNEREIRQLIINLARNAIEASPPSGIITLNTYVNNDEVVLSVEDEGIGIPPEIYDKLGTPFVTTKDNGTGLGVSICYSIAHKHNAKIDVETGTTGTVFYVRFKIPEGRENKRVS